MPFRMVAKSAEFPGSVQSERSSQVDSVRKSNSPANCERPRVADVALQSGGNLVGQLLTAQGHVQPHRPIVVWHQGKEVGRMLTDSQGRFAVWGLRGGVYQFAVDNDGRHYRLWAPGTAPPIANEELLIVSGTVVRGAGRRCDNGPGHFGHAGWGFSPFHRFLSRPWVLSAILATAIAVPLSMREEFPEGS